MKITKKIISSMLAISLLLGNCTNIILAYDDELNIDMNIEQGEPFIINGNLSGKSKNPITAPEKFIINYIKQEEKFMIDESNNVTFNLISKEDDKQDNQTIVRLQQCINDIPIYGADIVACIDYNDKLNSISGYIEPTDITLNNFDFKANKTKNDVINDNKQDIQGDIENISCELNVYLHEESYKLVYIIDTFTNKIIIDADSGQLIKKIDKFEGLMQTMSNIDSQGIFEDIKKISTIKIENEVNYNDGYYLYDKNKNIIVCDANNKTIDYFKVDFTETIPYYKTDNNFIEPEDRKFVDAYYYTTKANEFYKNSFGRQGTDGKNKGVLVIANSYTPASLAMYMPGRLGNKDCDILVFGNESKGYRNRAAAIDVVGHEYTHAIITNSANLDIENIESRAIDEAYADIFGTLIEFKYSTREKDWLIGEDITINDKYIRSLKNPERNHISKLDSYDSEYEYSGIISKVAYLISEGGTLSGTKFKGIGKDAMGKLFYDTLTQKLYTNSDITHFSNSLLDTANKEQKYTVKKALKYVGINELDLSINKVYSDSKVVLGKVKSGAKVKAYLEGEQIGKTVTADSKGNYKIEIPKQSVGKKLEVKASKKYYISDKTSRTIKGKITKLTSNKLNSHSTKISGITKSSTTVKAYVKGKQIGKAVVSDKNGNYKINIPKQKPGIKVVVQVSKPGYETTEKTVTVLNIFKTFTVNSLKPTSTSIRGKGLKGASVKAYINGKQIGKTSIVDSKGAYKISIPKQKTGTKIVVQMSKSGYTTAEKNITVNKN